MREKIHPKYFENATVTCSCGNTWTTGSTRQHITTDVCFKCHPFFTGEQRIVDTEGQVDRFIKRLEKRQETVVDTTKKKKTRKEKQAIVELVDEDAAKA